MLVVLEILDDTPASPISYWVPQLKLKSNEKQRSLEGASLSGKHMNAVSHLLSMQFPDMPIPQLTLCTEQPKINRFFSTTSMSTGNCLTLVKIQSTYLYDSLKPSTLILSYAKNL